MTGDESSEDDMQEYANVAVRAALKRVAKIAESRLHRKVGDDPERRYSNVTVRLITQDIRAMLREYR